MLAARCRCGLLVSTLLAAMCLPACEPAWPPGPFDEDIGPHLRRASLAEQSDSLPATAPAGATAPSRPTEALKLTVESAILMALENNRSLAVQRLNPAILRTAEQKERAVFDPTITAGASASRDRSRLDSGYSTDNQVSADVGASVFLPSGTTLGASAGTDRTWPGTDEHATRVGLSVTQSLLRGAGAAANLARLRQARLDVLASQYELRGFAESILWQVETSYWNHVLAQRQIEIYTQSLALAEQSLAETQERVRIGRLAETELAAAEAEVALRKEGLINARSALAKSRLRLLRLVNPPEADAWDLPLAALEPPVAPGAELEGVEGHLAVAMRLRADLNQARLALESGDLEVVRTKNGLLPRLDLFVNLGKTGYADSFGGSVADIAGGGYDLSASLRLEYPPGNRAAQADHRRAALARSRLAEALGNLQQLIQVDVRSAYVEVARAIEQVAATTATRKLQEEKLRAETEKFRVGKSTTLLVAAAQRDLLASQISEVQAAVNCLNALVDLYRLDGSLLLRRGIDAPGAEPVESRRTPR